MHTIYKSSGKEIHKKLIHTPSNISSEIRKLHRKNKSPWAYNKWVTNIYIKKLYSDNGRGMLEPISYTYTKNDRERYKKKERMWACQRYNSMKQGTSSTRRRENKSSNSKYFVVDSIDVEWRWSKASRITSIGWIECRRCWMSIERNASRAEWEKGKWDATWCLKEAGAWTKTEKMEKTEFQREMSCAGYCEKRKGNINNVNESNCRMKAATTSAMSYDDETTAKQTIDHRLS